MTNNVAELLASAPIFRELAPVDLAPLAAAASVRQLGRREQLWRAGAPARDLAVIVSGRLKVCRQSEAREVVVEVIGAGDVAGDVALSLHQRYAFDVVCLRRATVVLVPVERVAAAIDVSRPAARALSAELAATVVRLSRRIEAVSAGTVEQRLARVLIGLVERFGERLDGNGVLIPVSLRRRELASLAATTLESASRRLSRWKGAAIVQPQPAGFLVRDERALRRLVGGGQA